MIDFDRAIADAETLGDVVDDALASPDPNVDKATGVPPDDSRQWASVDEAGGIVFGFFIEDDDYVIDEETALSMAGSLLRAVAESRRRRA